MKRFVVLSLLTLWAIGSAEARKKIIFAGQDLRHVTPADLLAHADQFMKTPCNGLELPLHGTNPDGTVLDYRKIAGDVEWQYEAFTNQLDDLRKIAKMPCFADTAPMSFMHPPKHIDWRDDAGWARVAHNMSVVARLTREAGLRNNYIDWEDYTGAKQFHAVGGRDPSYDECVKLARRRGREVFGAVYREHPSLNILFFWLFTQNRAYYQFEADARAECRKANDLWPAFINGLLDALPPNGRVTDVNEHGYRFDYRAGDAFRDFYLQRGQALALIEPENRAKYLAQQRIGFTLYPDMLVRGITEPWYLEPVDGSRLEHFRRNAADMIEVADEYFVLWGERYPFIVWDRKIPQTPRLSQHHDEPWNVRLPGFYDGLAGARDGSECIDWRMAQLKEKGKLVNLVMNSKCLPLRETKSRSFIPGIPSWFMPWQDMKSEQGVYGIDNTVGEDDHSSICAKGVRSGLLRYTVQDVKPGEWYAVLASVKGPNYGMTIEFYENGYSAQRLGMQSVKIGKPDANGWCHVKHLVKVPLCIDAFQLRFNLSQKPDGVTWFDNISVYRLWPEAE